MTLKKQWCDSGREPKCPANPEFPDGIDVDLSQGKPSCFTKLDYPAKRCGFWFVSCRTCGETAAITTAGRPDDPRSVKLPCKGRAH